MTYARIAETLNTKGYTILDGKPFTGANVAMILRRV